MIIIEAMDTERGIAMNGAWAVMHVTGKKSNSRGKRKSTASIALLIRCKHNFVDQFQSFMHSTEGRIPLLGPRKNVLAIMLARSYSHTSS